MDEAGTASARDRGACDPRSTGSWTPRSSVDPRGGSTKRRCGSPRRSAGRGRMTPNTSRSRSCMPPTGHTLDGRLRRGAGHIVEIVWPTEL